MATFVKIKNKRIFEQVIEQIKEQIISGFLKPGDQLPSERQISEMMGVHRHSVREAFKTLEYLEILESKPGIGTIVSNNHDGTLLEKVLKLSVSRSKKVICELMEVRQVLEPRITALATIKATNSDLKVLEELIRQFEREEGVLDIDYNTDKKFHLAIVRATHNDTLMKFMEPIMDMMAEFRDRLAEIPKRRIKANVEHKAIYEAMRSGNARKAQITMQGHVDKIRELLDSLIK